MGSRVENQQDRIGQGVKSGSRTAGDTAKLDHNESSINHEVRTDRQLNGGHLTGQEKQIVNQQQNRMSNQIYQDKHSAATQHYGKNEVDSRRENQQDRIADGIQSGKLNAGQTARLEKHESTINQETRTDRTVNGGNLTQGEKTQINRQQNATSRQIYHAKHS